MIMKSKFDPNAAFRNIVGVTEETGEKNIPEAEEQEKVPTETVIIIGNKDKGETRSKRVNLVVKPSVYRKAKTKCEELNISLNECINQFLEKWSQD